MAGGDCLDEPLYIETRYPSDVELELEMPPAGGYETAAAVYDAVSALIYGNG